MAALAAYGVDDFNDISASNGTDSPLARNAGSFEYTASVEGYDYDISEPVVFWGTDRTGGNVALSTSFHDDTVTFSSFTGGVAAFGGYFFVTDINGTPRAGDIVLTVTDADGTFMDPITGATEGTFRGYISTNLIVSATFDSPGAYDFSNVDNLVLGIPGAVPEPASFAGIAALAALGATALRRRR